MLFLPPDRGYCSVWCCWMRFYDCACRAGRDRAGYSGDAGQRNDSYSLAVIAQKLAEAFALTSVNELPLAFNIAWYEQKAVIVLLALLSLGVKNIHLGPTLPAFLSPNVAKVLVDNFGIAGIGNVDDDFALFMN